MVIAPLVNLFLIDERTAKSASRQSKSIARMDVLNRVERLNGLNDLNPAKALQRLERLEPVERLQLDHYLSAANLTLNF
jgi:hypothetical protein